MSFRTLVPSLLVAALAVGATTAPAHAQTPGAGANVVITDIDVDPTDVVFDAATGLLTITEGTISGTIAGLPFTTDITNFVLDLTPPGGSPVGTCSVLDLELGPIDLDLLGAHVDTSRICLSITAIPSGGLLGQLLCGLAGGIELGGLLGVEDLLDGLPAVLGPVLTEALNGARPAAAGAADICDGECEVLDLAIGPVDLTLLGLNVHLDNCENGPVQVCVSASEGEGLLGDLLCGLAGGGGLLGDLGNLQDIVGAILDGLGTNTAVDATAKQVNQLVDQVGRLLRNGDLTDNELDRLTKSVRKLVRKAA